MRRSRSARRGEGVEAVGQVRVVGAEVLTRTGQRADQAGGVVVAQCLDQRSPGLVREARECGDLTGELTQVRGVATRPAGDGPVGGAPVAGGLDALFAGAAGGTGAQAQIAAFGGLPAGDAEGAGQIGPARTRLPGRLDQARLPTGELVAHLAQEQQCGEHLVGADLATGLLAVRRRLGAVDRLLDGRQRCLGGEKGHGLRCGFLRVYGHGHLPTSASPV
ncbi:hypothetical protein RKD29_000268 [Streptomyces tendae]